MKKFTRGNTLIEVLIALAVGGVVLSALTVLITNSLNNAQFSKNQNLATKYAQDGIEHIRRIRDENYTAFQSYNGTYCLDKEQTVLGSAVAACSTPNVDTFIRMVQIEQNTDCGTNGARVSVTVSWADGKCGSSTSYCHTSELTSCLSTDNPVKGL